MVLQQFPILLLANYDCVSDLKAISLDALEIWVSVRGLQVVELNEKVLTRIGDILGSFIKVYPTTL